MSSLSLHNWTEKRAQFSKEPKTRPATLLRTGEVVVLELVEHGAVVAAVAVELAVDLVLSVVGPLDHPRRPARAIRGAPGMLSGRRKSSLIDNYI
jgi:hypothetical protein